MNKRYIDYYFNNKYNKRNINRYKRGTYGVIKYEERYIHSFLNNKEQNILILLNNKKKEYYFTKTDFIIIPTIHTLRSYIKLFSDSSFYELFQQFNYKILILQCCLDIAFNIWTIIEINELKSFINNPEINIILYLHQYGEDVCTGIQRYIQHENIYQWKYRSFIYSIEKLYKNKLFHINNLKLYIIPYNINELNLIKNLSLFNDNNIIYIYMNEFIKSYINKNNNNQKNYLNIYNLLYNKYEDQYNNENNNKNQLKLPIYSSYLSKIDTINMIKNNKLYKGKVNIISLNEAMIILDNSIIINNKIYNEILINNKIDMNRCLHNDIVAIEIKSKDEWNYPNKLLNIINNDDNINNNINNNNNNILLNHLKLPTGKIKCILKRIIKILIATIPSNNNNNNNNNKFTNFLAIPMNKKYPKIRLHTKQINNIIGKRLVVMINNWDKYSYYPNGFFIKILGSLGNFQTEINAILNEYNLIIHNYGIKTLLTLPKIIKLNENDKLSNWNIPKNEILKRKDLRESHFIFSVDPIGCQDIDDTLSVKYLNNGNIELGIHIADVTYFIKKDTLLDLEAKERSTTIYLPHKRYDMLPKLLSSDLCSLHCNKDRLAFSILLELTPDYNIIPNKIWYGKTCIHSKASLTYEQADLLLNNKDDEFIKLYNNNNNNKIGEAGGPINISLFNKLKENLNLLKNISRSLKKKRKKNGGIDLINDEGELKFKLDNNNYPNEIYFVEDIEIHHTIAELMILANSCVAEKIYQYKPNNTLLRIHTLPSNKKINNLKELLLKFNVNINNNDNNINLYMENLSNLPKSINSYFKSFTIRSMQEAKYINSGDIQLNDNDKINIDIEKLYFSYLNLDNYNINNIKRFYHYGLGLSFYTHFTSPIRRYADMIVHRQLEEVLLNENNNNNNNINIDNNIEYIDKIPSNSLVPSAIELSNKKNLNNFKIIDDKNKDNLLNDLLNDVNNNNNKDDLLDDLLNDVNDNKNEDNNNKDDLLNDLLNDINDNKNEDNNNKDDLLDDLLNDVNDNNNEDNNNEDNNNEDELLNDLLNDVNNYNNENNNNNNNLLDDLILNDNHENKIENENDNILNDLIENIRIDINEKYDENNNDNNKESNIDKIILNNKNNNNIISNELTNLTINLNEKHRNAKLASMECNKLFLSLYFNKNPTIIDAVILSIKMNGLIIYIPKFDITGPLSLLSKDGILQIPPKLFDLNNNVGNEPDEYFKSYKDNRSFPNAIINYDFINDDNIEEKKNNDNDTDNFIKKLEIILPNYNNKKINFNLYDHILIQITCDIDKYEARIPDLNFNIIDFNINIENNIKKNKIIIKENNINNNQKNNKNNYNNNNNNNNNNNKYIKNEKDNFSSLYDIFNNISTIKNIELNNIKKNKKCKKKMLGKGRIRYNGFEPKTKFENLLGSILDIDDKIYDNININEPKNINMERKNIMKIEKQIKSRSNQLFSKQKRNRYFKKKQKN